MWWVPVHCRSWRYLTENWVMNLPPPSGDDGVRACPPTEILYTRCVKERLLLADTIGAESVCFKTPDDGHPNTIRGKEGVALGASIIVVFRVGSVVAKTYEPPPNFDPPPPSKSSPSSDGRRVRWCETFFRGCLLRRHVDIWGTRYIAARDRHIPTDIVQRGLRNAAARIETWCAAKSTPTVLRELPPDVRSFREEFMCVARGTPPTAVRFRLSTTSLCWVTESCMHDLLFYFIAGRSGGTASNRSSPGPNHARVSSTVRRHVKSAKSTGRTSGARDAEALHIVEPCVRRSIGSMVTSKIALANSPPSPQTSRDEQSA
jgi:hypothetical protein